VRLVQHIQTEKIIDKG